MSALKEALLKKKGIIPYFTFADPNIKQTEKLILDAIDTGAVAIEIGLPFSDPIADGPVIQESHQRVLSSYPDIKVDDAFDMVQRLRTKTTVPLIFMGDVNLVYQYGCVEFFEKAKSVGLSGVIIPDLNPNQAAEYINSAQQNQIDLIFLISSLCTAERRKQIVQASTGFVYLMARIGVTGENKAFNKSLKENVEEIKKIKDIPVCIGFGISSNEHVKEVFKIADGAIVGSYLVKFLAYSDDLEEQQHRIKKALMNLQS